MTLSATRAIASAVGHNHYTGTFVGSRTQQRNDRASSYRVDLARRLVRQQQSRFVRARNCERGAGGLTAGQVSRVRSTAMGQAESIEDVDTP